MKNTNLYKTYKIKKTTIISKILISITITILLLLLAIYILKTFVYPLKHFDIITKEAAENNLDPYLVISIIKTESSFNKYATSNKQAKGLMQIMDSTASDVNEKLETPIKNVYAIGDVIKKDIYQLVTATSDGARVIYNMK